MRACMIMNRDLPAHAPEYTAETELNRSYTQQSAEFEALLDKIDPEGDIDRDLFPSIAYFTQSEGWPLDIIFAGIAGLLVWLFMPNWYGIGKFVGFVVVGAYAAIQYLRSRRVRENALMEMQRRGLNPEAYHALTLRTLVKYRKPPVTLH